MPGDLVRAGGAGFLVPDVQAIARPARVNIHSFAHGAERPGASMSHDHLHNNQNRTSAKRVRAENPIRGCKQQSCGAGGPAVIITDHVPAVCLPADHANDHVAAAVPARGNVEDRRDFASAPPGHRPAAPPGVPSQAETGRTGPCSRPCPASDRDRRQRLRLLITPGHDRALPPRHPPAALGGAVHARQARPAATRRDIKALVPRLACENPDGGTAGSTGSWPGWESRSPRSKPAGTTCYEARNRAQWMIPGPAGPGQGATPQPRERRRTLGSSGAGSVCSHTSGNAP